MGVEGGLRTSLKQLRTRLGMSQQDLAGLAGVTRQTISALESGQYAPSAVVALRLARALECGVEELFWLEDKQPTITAAPAAAMPVGKSLRVAVARVGERWVAHPLTGEQAFRTELIPADGAADLESPAGPASVRLLDEPENLLRTVVLAGCTPALSLWARAAERWNPGLRVHWVYANSTAALAALRRCEVHAAGAHLYDPTSGEHNLPFVRAALPGRPAVLVNLGVWEEGLVVRSGNPRGIRSVADLAAGGLTIVNREPGAGCRLLLDRSLEDEGVPTGRVKGYGHEVADHLEVARAVASGQADTGVTAASMAAAFGLGFIPLHRVRYDMAIPTEYLEERSVRELLSTLSHRWVRSQLEALGGFDTAQTGEIVAEIRPQP